ncbi:hypothetical protein HNP38_002674 [Chryseobacterium defluvii]|uniref:DUF3667 domain-containing protein n=1 Tax=Chryseobacterium defluvii TaxID=160396 RepID=A0A840KIQ2_9FLAO|nr:DUF3667 domain-containing protein [Chryseobacterium defluvii]MBB4807370.1 hypothetical protein [Chryseobacterium defluvii]
MNGKCLNCNTTTENNFCSVCGQKTSTHRFSLKHFILHDFIHGVFHLDKGFLFTVKELFIRPGHSTREYIQGKRVKHFNYFTLLLIIIAVTHFIGSYEKVKMIDIVENKKNFEGFTKVTKEYAKLIALSWVPFYAFASYILFKKSKQNYSEHLVQTMYMIAGILMINYIFPIVTIFCSNIKALQYVSVFTELLKLGYFFWFYYQYFSAFNYKKVDLIIRCIVIVCIILFITGIIAKVVNKIGLMYFH